MLKKIYLTLFITLLLGNFTFADQKDKWSISIGQFDINDTIDSSEVRLELLYGNNFYENSNIILDQTNLKKRFQMGKFVENIKSRIVNL